MEASQPASATGPFTESNFRMWLGVMIAIFFLSTTTLSLRVYVRTVITRTFGTDDILLIVAHIFNIVACGQWLQTRREAVHVPINTQEAYDRFSVPTVITLAFYVAATALAKISIAMWFLAVVRLQNVILRRVIQVTLALYLLACITNYCVCLFRCGVPVDAVRAVNDNDCAISPESMYYATVILSVLNSVSDWVFALIPLYMLSQSGRMKTSARVSAATVVSLAILGSVISIARLPFLARGAKFGPTFLSNPAMVVAYGLSLLEVAVAVMAISLATLQPMMLMARKTWTRYMTTSASESHSYATPGGRRDVLAQPALPQPSHEMSSNITRGKTGKTFSLDLSALAGVGGVLGTLLMTVDETESAAVSRPRSLRQPSDVAIEPAIEELNVHAHLSTCDGDLGEPEAVDLEAQGSHTVRLQGSF